MFDITNKEGDNIYNVTNMFYEDKQTLTPAVKRKQEHDKFYPWVKQTQTVLE